MVRISMEYGGRGAERSKGTHGTTVFRHPNAEICISKWSKGGGGRLVANVGRGAGNESHDSQSCLRMLISFKEKKKKIRMLIAEEGVPGAED